MSGNQGLMSSGHMLPDSPGFTRNRKIGITSLEELQHYRSDYKSDKSMRASGQLVQMLGQQGNSKMVFSCTACSTPLFSVKDIIEHQPL